LNRPQSPWTAEVCADSAYVLFLDELVLEDAALDANDLAKIKTPNRDGFVSAYPFPGVGAKPQFADGRASRVALTCHTT
jgi:S-disulfanyl-L-cysteine oxidoreductase SoxD